MASDEMIGEITLAMVEKIGLRRIAEVIHSYPTQSEVIRKAAEAWICAHPPGRMGRLLARLLR